MNLALQKLIAVSFGALLGLSGCSIHEKIDGDAHKINNVKSELQKVVDSQNASSRVIARKGFYVPPLSKIETKMPDWYFSPVDSSFASMPFELIVADMLHSRPVTVKYNELSKEDKELPLTITFNKSQNGESVKLGDALNMLAKTAGYAISFEGDSVVFSKFEEQTFFIASLPGEYNSQIGNDGEMDLTGSSTSGTSSGSSSSQSMKAGASQYSSLSIKERSMIHDLESALKDLKSTEGKISISPMTMTVFVKERPTIMKSIARTIERFNDDLTKTIEFDITLLDVTYSSSNREAFDASLAANLLNSKLELTSNDATRPFIAGSGTTPSPSQFNLKFLTGAAAGTELFIDALKRTADSCMAVKIPKATVANGSMTKVMKLDSEMYVAEQSGNNATTGGLLYGGGATQENLQTGLVFNIFARSVEDDIIFKINVSSSTKVDLKVKENASTGMYLESPQTTAMIYDTTAILEDGVTRVITGISFDATNVTKQNAGYDLMGFSNTSETAKKETILLITPRIVRGFSKGRKGA